jgi:hypothetical protein
MLVQESKRFDVVCSMEVVEHVDNPGAFLRSCAELVKVRKLTACPPFLSVTFFVAYSLADISSSRRSHGHHSLISLRSWQPRKCSASSSPEHTPFPSSSMPRSSSVSSQSLLQKAPNRGFLGCMRMGCRCAWRPRYAGLSMFHGGATGF